MKRLLVALAFLCCATLAQAQTCNPPSGFLTQFGPITIGSPLTYGPTCGQIQSGAASSNLFSSLVTITPNVGNIVNPFSGTLLHIQGADGAQPSITIDAFQNGGVGNIASGVMLRNSGGSAAVPSATPNNVEIGFFVARGRGTTAYSTTDNGSIIFASCEPWTDAAQCAYATITVTPIGTNAAVQAVKFDPSVSGQLQVLLGNGSGLSTFLGFSGKTSGMGFLRAQDVAGGAIINIPTSSGTLVSSATAPLTIAATTGIVACATCATITNGGALSATAPMAISAAGVISLSTPVTGTFGGTGINNGASTITIGGNVAFSGAFTFAGTLSGATAVTFPTVGTLATLAGSEVFTNKTIASGSNTLDVKQVAGSATNDSASAGNLGETLTGTRVSGSAVSLVSGAASNITSVALTAGDWDLWGFPVWNGGATTTVGYFWASIDTTSAVSTNTNVGQFFFLYGNGATPFNPGSPNTGLVGPVRISINAGTTYFLNTTCSFGVSTCTAYGTIIARRRR